jgi:hypothetical protein
VNDGLTPLTRRVTGTTLVGWSMEFVLAGWAWSTSAVATGATDRRPWSSIRTGCDADPGLTCLIRIARLLLSCVTEVSSGAPVIVALRIASPTLRLNIWKA